MKILYTTFLVFASSSSVELLLLLIINSQLYYNVVYSFVFFIQSNACKKVKFYIKKVEKFFLKLEHRNKYEK